MSVAGPQALIVAIIAVLLLDCGVRAAPKDSLNEPATPSVPTAAPKSASPPQQPSSAAVVEPLPKHYHLVIPRFFSFAFEMSTNLSNQRVNAQGRGVVAFDNDFEPSLRLVYAYRTKQQFVQESVTGFGPLYTRKVYARDEPDELRPVAVIFPPRRCAVADTDRPLSPGPMLFAQTTVEQSCPVSVTEEIDIRVFYLVKTGMIAGFAYRDSVFSFRYVAEQEFSFPDSTFSREQLTAEEAPCDFWMQGGQECLLAPARTSPTQLDVGRAEVNEKFNTFVHLAAPQLKQRLAHRLLPIIIGPPKPGTSQRARYFLVDGHHQMAALHDASPGTPAPVYVLCNWRHMSEEDFFKRMEERHWTFLLTADGVHRTYHDLPQTFDQLGNSGYRALARLLIGRSVQKTCVPFAEFYWGSYLLNEGLEINPAHMGSLEDLSENYLDAAMWLARKPEASFLPGYMALGQHVPFVHPVCEKKVCDLMDDVELNLIPLPVAHCSLPGGICAKLAERYVAKQSHNSNTTAAAHHKQHNATNGAWIAPMVLIAFVAVVAVLISRRRRDEATQISA